MAGRGLYMAADADITEHYSLAQVCKRAPEGVICLLSALRFHEFTTQLPHQVWMAVRRNQWRPRLNDLSVRFIRYSDTAFVAGVERKVVDGVPIRVYSPAKTVADCFKFRNTVGLDVAMEALKEALRGRLCTREEIWQFACVCRVQNIIKPYMEMIS